ncbi:hypothetical protein QOZ80_5AG0367240 [Eleusine coracana subsp. coracana]|nr:hypothetical protein QOZ80_5AG0367240 [Eleusine coracana subsp. coracana]
MGLTLLFSLVVFFCFSGVSSSSQYLTSMFTLGDSYIDTGNAPVMFAPVMPVWIDNPPYGQTFFGHPSGRFSDGRVIIDFVAEEFGLPFLPAFLAKSSNVSQGVNFAVGGPTAIEVGFFERNNLVPFKLVNNSLDVQLGWFEEIKPSVCNGTEGYKDCFSKALFFVGELGVNDYNFIWMSGKTEDEVKTYVPKVVETITTAVERLINQGAVYIVVPGNPPTGCSPAILTFRMNPNKTNYDHIGCLRDVNRVARYHNMMLRAAVSSLRGKYPHARIIFADFYEPVIQVLQNPSVFGFNNDVLKACCGSGGGAYNWDPNAICAMAGVTACENPATYVSWDGVHYTEAMNRFITKGWLNGPYAQPPIKSAVRL